MKKELVLMVCVMLAGSASPVAADWDQEREQPLGPSYDCSRAQGTLEMTVCSDPLLSRMDLGLSIAYQAALDGSASTEILAPSPRTLLRDQLKAEQQQWLQAREDSCILDFDFGTEINVRYQAVQCLINSYAKRLVELGGEQSLLDALVDAGMVVLGNATLDLGNVQFDLPQVLPTAADRSSTLAIPHPACIHDLLRTLVSTPLDLDACHAGTGHVPVELGDFFARGDGDYATYVPWRPDRLGQINGDRFGYRMVGELRDGGVLIHVVEEYSGAGRTHADSRLVMIQGLRRGHIDVAKRRIAGELPGFCGGGIHDAEVAGPDVLTLTSYVDLDRLVTLFDLFPEQLPKVPEPDRRRLRALGDDLTVAGSIYGSTCIGGVQYEYDMVTGARHLLNVSVDVAEIDGASVEPYPVVACLFDLLHERELDLSAMLEATEFGGLLVDFLRACVTPRT